MPAGELQDYSVESVASSLVLILGGVGADPEEDIIPGKPEVDKAVLEKRYKAEKLKITEERLSADIDTLVEPEPEPEPELVIVASP